VIGLILGSLYDLYNVICSLGYSVTHLLQLSERDVGKILPVANNCANVHVRFSTFIILENVGKIKKNVKKRKNVTRIKRFLHLC